MAEAFAPGTPVVLRGLFRRRIWVAQGAMVVSDSPERTVLALDLVVPTLPEGWNLVA